MPLSPSHDTTGRWKCQGGNGAQRPAVSNLRQLTDTASRCRGLSCILDRGERFDGERRVEGSVEEHAMECGSGRVKLRFPRVLLVRLFSMQYAQVVICDVGEKMERAKGSPQGRQMVSTPPAKVDCQLDFVTMRRTVRHACGITTKQVRRWRSECEAPCAIHAIGASRCEGVLIVRYTSFTKKAPLSIDKGAFLWWRQQDSNL